MARAAERHARAWQLRLAGASFVQIGKELGVSRQRAQKYIRERQDELAAVEVECAKQMRVEETERLNGYLLNLARAIQVGDVTAIRTAVTISARKAALWSLDGPTKVEIENETVDVSKMSLEELQQKRQEVLARLSAAGAMPTEAKP